MSLFLKLERLDPYALFATVLRRSRLSMEAAYQASFDAYLRSVALLEEHRYASWHHDEAFNFVGLISGAAPAARPAVSRAALDAQWLEAIAEDFQCDQQAAPVILFADDTLQRFAKGVFGKALGLAPGFGPAYGPEYAPPAHLTTLLRAATNTLRHVSEWDDNPNLRFPYPDPSTLKKGSPEWQAMQSISVLQRVFGIGKHEPIRDVVSCRVLIQVDGQLGTAPASYARFEAAIIEAARDIARIGPPQGLSQLEAQLTELGTPAAAEA